MSNLPKVAIVGRPNVGKSSLFNRIVGKRIAVVDDMPGITRDRNYVDTTWNGVAFTAVDTGGMISFAATGLAGEINRQVEITIAEADIIVFVVELGTGALNLDVLVAKLLRKKALEKVFLAVNKAESKHAQFELGAFASLGLGDPWPVSALHGTGVSDMLDAIIDKMNKLGITNRRPPLKETLKLAVVGRPNAGKSSLINKLLKSDRMIVDSTPGTTRDSIDSPLTYHGKSLVLIDTAGLREKGRVKDNVEYYCNLRSLSAVDRCDIAILLIDATKGAANQDLKIIEKIAEAHKGLVVVLSKWDLVDKTHKTFDENVADYKSHYAELRHVPFVSISSLTGQRVTTVLDVAFTVKERMMKKVSASSLIKNLKEWTRATPHPVMATKSMRFMGVRQMTGPCPIFRFFLSYPRLIAPSYHRYLLNKLHTTYDFEGCFLQLEYRLPAGGARGHKHGGGHEEQGE